MVFISQTKSKQMKITDLEYITEIPEEEASALSGGSRSIDCLIAAAEQSAALSLEIAEANIEASNIMLPANALRSLTGQFPKQ